MDSSAVDRPLVVHDFPPWNLDFMKLFLNWKFSNHEKGVGQGAAMQGSGGKPNGLTGVGQEKV